MECITHDKVDEYGYSKKDGANLHRTTYKAEHGSIPVGFQIHHLCGNKACYLVEHLVALSVRDHGKLHRTKGDVGEPCPSGHGTS